MKKITDFGKARANKFASALNNAKFSDNCECLDIPVCEHLMTSSSSPATVLAVTVDDTTYNINSQVKDFAGNVLWTPTMYNSNGIQIRGGSDLDINRPYVVSFLLTVLYIMMSMCYLPIYRPM